MQRVVHPFLKCVFFLYVRVCVGGAAMVKRFGEITADLMVISLPPAPARCLLTTTTMNIHRSLTNVEGRMQKQTCLSTHRGAKRQRNFDSVFPIFPP